MLAQVLARVISDVRNRARQFKHSPAATGRQLLAWLNAAADPKENHPQLFVMSAGAFARGREKSTSLPEW
jgi:hypothetical protein